MHPLQPSPLHLSLLQLCPLWLLLACSDPTIPLPADATELDRAVIEELEADAAPGLQAAVFRDGAVVLERGWGFADTSTGALVDTESLFMIASISKLFIGVAAMQLVEEGRLDLDAPIDAALGFEVRNPGHPEVPITMRHLLTHASGIRDDWDVLEAHYVLGDSPIALGDYLEGYFSGSGPFAGDVWHDDPPGWRFDYSNMGSSLAALVIERIAGQSFAAFTAMRIFMPAGMAHTGWFLADVDENRVAVPTGWSNRDGWAPHGHYGYPDYPDGALRTSAGQLARFFMAAFLSTGEGALLEDATRTEMFRAPFPELDPTQAHLIYEWSLDDERLLGHDGGDDGVATEAFFRPMHGDGVVLLSNGDLSEEAIVRLQRRLLAEGR